MSSSENIGTREPRQVWQIFEMISSHPHPSGHEKILAEHLAEYAKRKGLSARFDASGNLRIDRPAAPGYENTPAILLEAHMDMVPAALDPAFDFVRTPVTPVAEGDWVHALGTSLGGDDGIGLALSLALLCDKNLQCGPLAAIFTWEEETGLKGAAALDPEFLKGEMLLNLDNEDGTFCIGCAGGAREKFFFSPRYVVPPSGAKGMKITLRGLAGGHSGVCIHENRGNAIRFLAQFIDVHTHFHCGELRGGAADNQIPDSCFATGYSEHPAEELKESAEKFIRFIRRNYNVPETFSLSFQAIPAPQGVWTEPFQHDFLTALSLAPDGVLENDERLGIVRTSSNLASVVSERNEICVCTSQRSLIDAHREMASDALKRHFATFGARRSEEGSVYPAWTPQPDTPLLRHAQAVWKELFGTEVTVGAVHAGLESGWFAQKNPALQLLALGPVVKGIHTPEERVSLSSVRDHWRFLRQLLETIAKKESRK